MRDNHRPAEHFPELRHLYIIFCLLGLAFLGALLIRAWPLPVAGTPGRVYGWIALAALTGFILRAIRRRMVFGARMSPSQTAAFEIIVQIVQMFSPLIPRRAFEAEFIIRETGDRTGIVDTWLDARTLSTSVAVLAGLAWVARWHAPGWLAAAIGGIALGVMAVGVRKRRPVLSVLWTVLAGLMAWAAEGLLFVQAALLLGLTPRDAWTIYLLFTGLVEFSPIPLGLGLVELPAVVFPAHLPAGLWLLLLFHLARVSLLLALGAVYLRRYKFTLAELFNPNIIAAIVRTQRPAAGWTFQGELTPGMPRVSVVIPAYNEERRLPLFLENVRRYMDGCPWRMEALVVDDGSRDATVAVVQRLAGHDPRIRLIRQDPNQGKGAALRRGMLAAGGLYILFADADGATPIAELDKFLPMLEGDAEIVIGSRKAGGAGVIREREGFRELMGTVFYRLVNFFAVPGIRDTQCGFKLFRRDVAGKLFSRAQERGWAIDVEVLYLAQLMGFSIRETAVNWHAVEGSKVRPLLDSLRMFFAIFRIRRRHAGFLRHE